MSQSTPIACALEEAEVQARARFVEELGERLVALELRGQNAALEFEPAAAADLAEFVREESRCCPFFEFELSETAELARLGVAVPEDGVPALRGLVAGFLGGWTV